MKINIIYRFFLAGFILLAPFMTSCDEDCDYNHDYCSSIDAEHGGFDNGPSKPSTTYCSVARDCGSGYVCKSGVCKKS